MKKRIAILLASVLSVHALAIAPTSISAAGSTFEFEK